MVRGHRRTTFLKRCWGATRLFATFKGAKERVPVEAQERVYAYLEELKTTQRYRMYRALQHPLYPLLRKIDRRDARVDIVQAATRAGRVIYASNHKSHTDYLVQPLVLDDNGIRPPVIAAGINLFGGALGLIHKHVTGAIPIRREMKDPAYLTTLKAYVAEVLQRHDLFLYVEGGRSYSGELKPFKTGLLHAAVQARRTDVVVIPVAIAYDLVLEDFILARQRIKRQQRPFVRGDRRDGSICCWVSQSGDLQLWKSHSTIGLRSRRSTFDGTADASHP